MTFTKCNVCLIFLIICSIISTTYSACSKHCKNSPSGVRGNCSSTGECPYGCKTRFHLANCTLMQYFKPKLLCHCNGICSASGDCIDGCDKKWMGTKCQYVNLADTRTVSVSGQEYTIALERHYWLYWMQIQSSAQGQSIEDIRVSVFSNKEWVTCESLHSVKVNSDYNIFCDQPLLANKVKIVGWTAEQPKILISGGMNKAILQYTNQSSMYGQFTSDLPVHGYYSNILQSRSCSHTSGSFYGSSDTASWSLTFDQEYQLRYILLHNRGYTSARLDNYGLHFASKAKPQFQKYMRPKHGVAGSGFEYIVLNHTMDITAMMVTAFTTVNIICLCGVEIFTDCTNNSFNYECSQQCHCKDPYEACNKVFGSCTSGCADGYLERNCQKECNPGKFGPKCQSTCNCLNNKVCSITDGFCALGCPAGYIGDACQKVCDPGFYGINCTETCSEVCIGPCDVINGNCLNCTSGWKGDQCEIECDPGFYGSMCTETCSDACVGPCDIKNGHCFKCKFGWKGDQCKTGRIEVLIGISASVLLTLLLCCCCGGGRKKKRKRCGCF